MYVLNEYLTAICSCTTKYFGKNSCRSWYVTSLRFFWHFLRPNRSIFGGTVSHWKKFENGKIAVFEGKWRRFRIFPKVKNLTPLMHKLVNYQVYSTIFSLISLMIVIIFNFDTKGPKSNLTWNLKTNCGLHNQLI